MKRSLVCFLMAMFVFPAIAMGEDFRALLDQADALVTENLPKFNSREAADMYLKSADLCVKAVAINPDSFEANWKAARGYRLYCQQVKWVLLDDWEAECADKGKRGMQYGSKAMELSPERVEGHFWYGCCVGAYSDGVSILTALKEGIKNKTQKGFEMSEKIDPTYWEHCPYLCLGEFWYLLPWPMQDKKAARKFLDKYLEKAPAGSGNYPEGQLFLGMLLAESKDKGDKARARELLNCAVASGVPFFKTKAEAALKKL